MSRYRPLLLLPDDPSVFPDPRRAGPKGLVAVGGDLSVERLLAAYDAGIFPWFNDEVPLWWSPEPRAVFTPTALHVPRRLAQTLRKGRFELRFDTAFDAVMDACGERPEGTWIVPSMREAFGALHRAGHAHSVEVWTDGDLTGGLYGVQRGAFFAAESMFHRRTDMSKVALVATVRSFGRAGVELIDCQFRTPHLASLGALTLSRDEYLERLDVARRRPVELGARPLDWR